MNDYQQIFVVFFAIFWGAIFNVLARWKPYNFGLIFDREVTYVTRRIGLALIILTLFPLLYFIVIFYILGQNSNLCDSQKKCIIEVIKWCLSSIIPAFAIYGFYRLWIGIIECSPESFYCYSWELPNKYKSYYNSQNKPEPSLEELGILRSNIYSYWKNMLIGSAYILFSGVGAILPYTMTVLTMFFIIISITFKQTSLLFLKKLSISLIVFIIILCLIIYIVGIYYLSYYCRDYKYDLFYILIKNIFVKKTTYPTAPGCMLTSHVLGT